MINKIKFPLRKVFEMLTTRDYQYHRDHRMSAHKTLKNIEKVKGKTNPKFLALSDEYAKEVLGWEGYAPWLYVYCAAAGIFKEGWIPDNYYGRVVMPAIKGRYGHFISIKPITNIFFRSRVFPDIAYYVNGIFFTHEQEFLAENKVRDILFAASDTVVFKSDSSYRGEGVFFFNKGSFDVRKVRSLGNGVFQEYIQQHGFFDEIMPSSVATLRMTSVMDKNGNFSIRACYLRVGRRKDTHVKSHSAIRIPVDPANGELSEYGYLTNWAAIERHPDSGFVFSGQRIPFFDKCASIVLNLHKSMPYVRCIGWDLCVDNNNDVKMMECNGGHNGIKFTEATQGPCFADLGWEKLWRENSGNS